MSENYGEIEASSIRILDGDKFKLLLSGDNISTLFDKLEEYKSYIIHFINIKKIKDIQLRCGPNSYQNGKYEIKETIIIDNYCNYYTLKCGGSQTMSQTWNEWLKHSNDYTLSFNKESNKIKLNKSIIDYIKTINGFEILTDNPIFNMLNNLKILNENIFVELNIQKDTTPVEKEKLLTNYYTELSKDKEIEGKLIEQIELKKEEFKKLIIDYCNKEEHDDLKRKIETYYNDDSIKKIIEKYYIENKTIITDNKIELERSLSIKNQKIIKFMKLINDDEINYDDAIIIIIYFANLLDSSLLSKNRFNIKNNNALIALQIINKYANKNKIRVEDAKELFNEHIKEVYVAKVLTNNNNSEKLKEYINLKQNTNETNTNHRRYGKVSSKKSSGKKY